MRRCSLWWVAKWTTFFFLNNLVCDVIGLKVQYLHAEWHSATNWSKVRYTLSKNQFILVYWTENYSPIKWPWWTIIAALLNSTCKHSVNLYALQKVGGSKKSDIDQSQGITSGSALAALSAFGSREIASHSTPVSCSPWLCVWGCSPFAPPSSPTLPSAGRSAGRSSVPVRCMKNATSLSVYRVGFSEQPLEPNEVQIWSENLNDQYHNTKYYDREKFL